MDKNVAALIRKTDPRTLGEIEKLALGDKINEIRFRKGRHVSVTTGDENVLLSSVTDESTVKRIFDELCQGSVYAHLETIKNGYIMLENGVRAGVCGRAVIENGAVKNVYAIESINIRLPHPIYGISGRIIDKIIQKNYYLSLLIYSAPGAGKTTMLRDLAYEIAHRGGRRVVIIDSRCEISDERTKRSEHTDILYSYPKAEAIEIATRTLNPQYLICDEIGSYEECLSLLSVQNAGVPVVATAHASNVIELLRRRNIALLHENGMFDMYIGLKRSYSKLSLSFCASGEVEGI